MKNSQLSRKEEIEPSDRQKKRFQKAMGIDKHDYKLDEQPCLRCVLDGEKVDCKGVKI
jgi:hypothetical protein